MNRSMKTNQDLTADQLYASVRTFVMSLRQGERLYFMMEFMLTAADDPSYTREAFTVMGAAFHRIMDEEGI